MNLQLIDINNLGDQQISKWFRNRFPNSVEAKDMWSVIPHEDWKPIVACLLLNKQQILDCLVEALSEAMGMDEGIFPEHVFHKLEYLGRTSASLGTWFSYLAERIEPLVLCGEEEDERRAKDCLMDMGLDAEYEYTASYIDNIHSASSSASLFAWNGKVSDAVNAITYARQALSVVYDEDSMDESMSDMIGMVETKLKESGIL